jgi:Carboxypeptidase regulatory-like domain
MSGDERELTMSSPVNRALFFLVTVLPAMLMAQSTDGRIVGTVSDQTKGVVPGAQVTITNLDTSRSRQVTAGADGAYAVTNLPVGNYEVSVEAQGFKRFLRKPVILTVDQTARVDALLEPGQITESITVEGGAPLIASESSAVGQVVNNTTIVDLPLNGRNFISLGLLTPGTTGANPNASTVRSRSGGAALTANGQRADHNNYLLDGVDNNETNLGLAVLVPSVDAIQEFKVQTSNYSAEFGRGAGAVINVAIKSGTNQLHGTVFEFVRNDIFDSRNAFVTSKDPLRRNQFGFSAGAPVYVPQIYDGRNKTFWFFNYEGLRERRGKTSRLVVPTDAQRAGDFSGLPTIYDPLNVSAGSRVPFANNRIPGERLSPIASKILALYARPNSSGAYNYVRPLSDPTDGDQIHVRFDHSFSAADQVMVRLSHSDRSEGSKSPMFNSTTTDNHPRGGVVTYTRLLSPSIVNEARFGVQRYFWQYLPEGIGEDHVSEFGLPVFGVPKEVMRYPVVSITNIAGFGGLSTIPVNRAENTYQWSDSLSISRGRHAMKLGGDFRIFQFNNRQPQTVTGNYTFTGAFTGVRGSQYSNGLADFLLGLPYQQSILNMTGYHPQYIRNNRMNLFIQDDVQIGNRLTLNIGLRYELEGAWSDKYDRWAYFDFASGQVVYPRAAAMSFTSFPYPARFDDISSITQPHHGFAPRFGLAFRPFGNSSTVIRSAYGIFWAQSVMNPIGNTAGTAPPYFLRQTLTSGTTSPELAFGVFPNADPSALLPAQPSFFTLNPKTFRSGYVQQWNFGIERQLFQDIALKASYVGSKGTHLEMRYGANAALPPAAGAVQTRRQFPLFGSMTVSAPDAYSTYHSLQISTEKRFSKGLLFLAGYTWSKALDLASQWGGFASENLMPQDPLRWYLDKGRSAHDLRQRFTLSYVYQLPFRFRSRVVSSVLAGWESSGVISFQTGFPFTVQASGDIPNIGSGTTNTRADLVGNPRVDTPTVNRWFNTEAFARPAAYTYGNSGRNILDGPGVRNLDLTIMKRIRIAEGHSLQLRLEAFNAFNHPNYSMPDASVGSTTIGSINGATDREMQVGLKYIF